MGSVMTAARSPGIVADRRFYMGAAAALVGVTFIGFAPSYYLANAFDAPALSPLVHLHGIVFSTWMLLFFGQTWLIAARRADLHRIAGMFGAGLAVVMVVLGIVVAIESGRLGHGPPTRNQPAFLIQPLADITLFQKRIQGSLFGESNPNWDILRQVELYRSGVLKLDEVITKTYTLDELPQGYEDMHAGKNQKGVVVFD